MHAQYRHYLKLVVGFMLASCLPTALTAEELSSCSPATLENLDIIISCVQVNNQTYSTRLNYLPEKQQWHWTGQLNPATCTTSLSECVTLTDSFGLSFPKVDIAGSAYKATLNYVKPTDNSQDYYWSYASHASTQAPQPGQAVTVLAFNDLGMHCMDKDFSVFSILPPFNVVNAQVVRPNVSGQPTVLNADQVELRYSAIDDRNRSVNSTSKDKTNFWQYSKALFGKELQLGEGLTGLYMPADNPQGAGGQLMSYQAQQNWFTAAGIPITPIDDSLHTNYYPMLRVSAYDKQNGQLLGQTDVVVPVSTETNCQGCHATGQVGASDTQVTWASDAAVEIQARKNILLLHDYKHFTDLINSMPVLCSSCHYSAPLDLTGQGTKGMQQRLATSSQVMHRHHGQLLDKQGNALFPSSGTTEQTCYQCHPGKDTQCERGAMKSVGITCVNCHGDMSAVGGVRPLQIGGSLDGTQDGNSRRAWKDLPRCQSCHTGDVVTHLTGSDLVTHTDGFRLHQAYRSGDSSASPILATNKRFAENDNTLFRNSKGHGGVACEGCHGSTHAIWLNDGSTTNDSVTAEQIQGHGGVLMECSACHAAGTLSASLDGPHGMHPVNDESWIERGHIMFYMQGAAKCQACHGANLEGSPLAKMSQTRSINAEHKTVTLEKGQQVSCNLCHSKPR